MARFQVRLERVQHEDVRVEADSPEEAIDQARAIVRDRMEWYDITDEPSCVWLQVKCPHTRVTQNHDPEGIADCLDCHGDDWIDVEVPQ